MDPGEIRVWLVHLDRLDQARLPPPTEGETARAARFRTEELQGRYMAAHRALRAILQQETGAPPLKFAVTKHGKPYLPEMPEVNFNLSHSREMAAVAVARGVEVGIDVERLRPLRDYMAIAERFLPPTAAAEFAAAFEPDPEREFFRRWTRSEAMWKAAGIGIYGAGRDLEGEWTIEEIDAGPEFAAAVAAPRAGLTICTSDF
jgi:4'-phosphopantetheinyl transferase